MRAGVTMRDPSTVYLDWDVDLAPDVTLEPNVILRGATSVGEGSVIGAGSQLVDAAHRARGAGLGERRRVVDGRGRRSVGPFSHLRPGSTVGAGAEVGNFAELKNTRLGPGSKQHHMSYLGDADDRRAGEHRCGRDHGQLRRHAKAAHDHRRRRVHRRRHDAHRAGRDRGAGARRAPAPS